MNKWKEKNKERARKGEKEGRKVTREEGWREENNEGKTRDGGRGESDSQKKVKKKGGQEVTMTTQRHDFGNTTTNSTRLTVDVKNIYICPPVCCISPNFVYFLTPKTWNIVLVWRDNGEKIEFSEAIENWKNVGTVAWTEWPGVTWRTDTDTLLRYRFGPVHCQTTPVMPLT